MSGHPDVTGPDDLTRIKGIGSKRAERLHAAGIQTYVDLASRSADDIAKLLSDEHGLSQARLDSWRDQARELAVAAPARAVPTTRAPAAVPHPRDESQPAVVGGAAVDAYRARLASSAVLSVERPPLRATEPFTMTMTIFLADPASHADRLAYSATIVAWPMAGGPKQTVAQTSGLFPTTSPTISIDAAGLPAGAYRLDGAVSLREHGGGHSAYLAAMIERLLVQILPG